MPRHPQLSREPGPIGVFDSGYGGLTVLRHIVGLMPEYDYLYLGDNARAPYGTRSFEVVYRFTLEAVERLFCLGCHLVVLACNTASAKALRTIQQRDLPLLDPQRRVLGVVRPTVERLGKATRSRRVGLLATPGTVRSRTYELETAKLFPDISVTPLPCPMWVPLVECGQLAGEGAEWFVRERMETLLALDPAIDTVILGCTHYPLLLPLLRRFTPEGVTLLPQGEIVAASLRDYLRRHPDMEARLTRGGTTRYLTTEGADIFEASTSLFLGHHVQAEHISLS